MASYVLIGGAWLGEWCWDRVAPWLRAAGHDGWHCRELGAGHDAMPTVPGAAAHALIELAEAGAAR